MEDRVYIFDTTLRDGEQSPGISLNLREKLEIAEQLEKLGVDVIEAGFPITSLGDFEAVSTVAKRIRGCTIAGLARAVDGDIDRAWEALKGAERPRIHTFIATSDIHIERKLRKNKDEVLLMIRNAVTRAKRYCPDVEFSPEDATRSEPEFLAKAVSTAIEYGATVINIPDTVGYTTPDEFKDLLLRLQADVPALNGIIVSVHCHNDLGLAVANSLAAVTAGARQIECTINGLGERAGNAAMEEIVMILDTRKRSLGKITGIRTEEISKTSRLVSSLTGYQVQFNKAIVGRNAFAHSSGIHTDGVLKDRITYEIIDPKKIGLVEGKIVLGKTSGRHALKARLAELGIELTDEDLDKAFIRFKELADRKKEISDRDLEAIVSEEIQAVVPEAYKLEHLMVQHGTREQPKAVIGLMHDGSLLESTQTGDGPVDAAFAAIDAIVGLQPELLSFTINALTEEKDALGEANIQLQIMGKRLSGRAVSTDIVDASVRAYLSAINRYMHGIEEGEVEAWL